MRRLFDLLPRRVIFSNGGPYLTRYRLLSFGKRFVRVYLHHIHRPDEDLELHNHPWKWALAIVLRSGYVEERPYADGVTYLRRTPGSAVLLTADTFHRIVELLDSEGSWSLFIAGPEAGTWYFMDRSTRRLTPWREFIRNKGLTPLETN